MGLAFVVENFVGGITSADQLESVTRTTATVVVPRFSGQHGIQSPADALGGAPLSAFSESIRRIRLNLEQQRPIAGQDQEKRGAVVMVTSSLPNEGKTTVALALGRAYAMAGKATLIIDCDLRRPGLHQQLRVESTTGLFEYLTEPDSHRLHSIMAVDAQSGAQVVLGSRRSDVATDQLIGSLRFAELVNAARAKFDIVILDTPPIGPVVDGLYAAAQSDAVVLVVRWSTTPQPYVRASMRMLNKAKKPDAEIVSVLNQEKSARLWGQQTYGGYYSYN